MKQARFKCFHCIMIKWISKVIYGNEFTQYETLNLENAHLIWQTMQMTIMLGGRARKNVLIFRGYSTSEESI